MKQGIDPQHFAGMRKSRTRGVGLKGDLDGFRASKRVWTCVSCTHEVHASPYAKPHTRARPKRCSGCKGTSWVYSASQSEADRYIELRQRHDVTDLQHPPRPLPIHIETAAGDRLVVRHYTPDFRYAEHGFVIVEDHKPHNRLTELAKFIHTLIWWQHGIDVLVTWYTGRRKSRRIHQAWSSMLR